MRWWFLLFWEKVSPPSVERANETPKFFFDEESSKSRQRTYTSPSASTAISQPWPAPPSVRFTGGENVRPSSEDARSRIVGVPKLGNFVQHSYRFPAKGEVGDLSTSIISLSPKMPAKFAAAGPFPTLVVPR